MDIAQILTNAYPGAQWSLNGDDYLGLEWLDTETPKPTVEDLESHWQQVQFDVATAAVESARKAAYAADTDPLFFDFQRGEVTEQVWLDAVQAVKDANPWPLFEDFAPEPVIPVEDVPVDEVV